MSEGPPLVANRGEPPPSGPNNPQSRSSRPRNRPPRRPRQGAEGSAAPQTPQEHREGSSAAPRPRNVAPRAPREPSAAPSEGATSTRPPRRRRNHNNAGSVEVVAEQAAQLTLVESSSTAPPPATRTNRSRKQFGSQLTSAHAESSVPRTARRPPANQTAPVDLDALDLTSRLIYQFTHKDDALDCPICFNSIHPAQPIWSCSLSNEADTCCWGTFHLKCIRSWAAKSM